MEGLEGYIIVRVLAIMGREEPSQVRVVPSQDCMGYVKCSKRKPFTVAWFFFSLSFSSFFLR